MSKLEVTSYYLSLLSSTGHFAVEVHSHLYFYIIQFKKYISPFIPQHVCPQNNITNRSEAEKHLFLQRAFNTSLKLALGEDSPTTALPSVGPSANLSQPMCNLSTFNVSISLDMMDTCWSLDGTQCSKAFPLSSFQRIMYNVKSTYNKLPTSEVSNINIQEALYHSIPYFYFTTVLNYWYLDLVLQSTSKTSQWQFYWKNVEWATQ